MQGCDPASSVAVTQNWLPDRFSCSYQGQSGSVDASALPGICTHRADAVAEFRTEADLRRERCGPDGTPVCSAGAVDSPEVKTLWSCDCGAPGAAYDYGFRDMAKVRWAPANGMARET